MVISYLIFLAGFLILFAWISHRQKKTKRQGAQIVMRPTAPDGSPLAAVAIKVFNNQCTADITQRAAINSLHSIHTSDPSGYIVLHLAPGRHHFRCVASGKVSREITLDVRGGQNYGLWIAMEDWPESIESNWISPN